MPETLPNVRKSIRVPISASEAFDRFTRDMPEWWPLRSHSMSASEGKQPRGVTLQPHTGGRIREIRHDGDVAEWATITIWEPGRRLALDWYVGRRRAEATQIDVSFSDTGDGGSRVDLTHRGFERLGVAGEAAASNYDEGWDFVLGEAFLLACDTR
ncbi:SRPBCC domain-containing protein [Tropicimonas marinistellae]|uniref:SRPBCC domain-containing protein n=1 Tax=Tropicimonas marinistellae TaxID=1739787 RepID=UPI0008311605|nr:SRPBCC domain-containing protein [Tropicimonas marinistellae]